MKPVSASRGFTLIELLFVVAIIAILASIALPAYQDYVKKGHANTAAADLSALASSVENHFQRTLSYHVGHLTDTAATSGKFSTWAPASKDHFKFEYKKTETGLYELKATGTSTQMSGCNLTLDQENTRTPTSPDSKCGGFKW